jgi:hypothetical protein
MASIIIWDTINFPNESKVLASAALVVDTPLHNFIISTSSQLFLDVRASSVARD